MPIGLPKNSEVVYNTLPERVSGPLSNYYLLYSKIYLSVATWYRYGRKYDAPLEPLKLYSISPKDIEYIPLQKPGTVFESSVRSGNWDKRVKNFIDSVVHKSFLKRFRENLGWEETPLYNYANSRLKSGKEWKGCATKSEVIERLQSYDDLYRQIKKQGYKAQEELRSNNTADHLQDKRHHPPEFSEITVDVGRDGNLVWFSGQHRLSIAKILEIDTIPVRFRCRHEKWQAKRDEVWNNTSKDSSWHPDLQQPE